MWSVREGPLGGMLIGDGDFLEVSGFDNHGQDYKAKNESINFLESVFFII